MKTLSLFLTIGCFISCNYDDSEYFSLKNNDRIIPIEVKGNTSSDILIVRLSHRGISYDQVYNGDCSSYYNCIHYQYFHSNSVGKYCDNIGCNLSNLSTDLDLLIYTLDQKYGDSKSIFLYGNGLAASVILYYASKGAYWNYLDGIIIRVSSKNQN